MKKFLLIIFVALITFLWGSPFIFGDGYGYYHVGKQLSQGNLFVSDKAPSYLEDAKHAVSYHEGKYATVYTPASGIIWSPLLLISENINDPVDVDGQTFIDFNGHKFWDGFIILSLGVIFCLISYFFTHKTIENLGFQSKIAKISTMLIFMSTYIFAYTFTNAAYSHIYELLGVSGMLYFLTKYSQKFEVKNMFWSGFFTGFAVLARTSNVVILIPTLLYTALWRGKKATVYFMLGGLPFLFVNLIYNYISYGNFFTTGYSSIWNVGLDFSQFNLFYLLFSDIRGLFVWSPLVIISLIGLLNYSARSKQGFLLYISPVLFTFLLFSFWENWWAGDSVGQRFFIVLIPYFAIGLAHLFRQIEKNKKSDLRRVRRYWIQFLYFAIFSLTIFSLSTLVLHRFTPTAELGESRSDYQQVTAAERFGVSDIWNYHVELAISSDGPKDYFAELQRNLNGGRSLILLFIDIRISYD